MGGVQQAGRWSRAWKVAGALGVALIAFGTQRRWPDFFAWVWPLYVLAGFLAGWRSGRREVPTRAALQRSEARLRLAARAGGIGTFELGFAADGATYFSPETIHLYGLPAGLSLPAGLPRGRAARWLTAQVHPEDRARVTEKLERGLALGTPTAFHDEHRILCPDGSTRWVQVDALLTGEGSGPPMRGVRATGSVLDITERKRLEESLRLEEAKSSGILAVTPDAIVSLDAERRITLFNQGAERTFGCARLEVLGAPFESLLAERCRESYRALVERFERSQEVAWQLAGPGGPLWGRRQDGREFPAEAFILKVQAGAQRVLTVGVRDVSARHRLDAEQRVLSELGALLALTLDGEQVLEHVARVAADRLATVCVLDVVGDDGRLRRARVRSRDPALSWACERLAECPRRVAPPRLSAQVVDTGCTSLRVSLSESLVRSLAEDDAQADALQAIAPRAILSVPLHAGGRLHGVLTLLRGAREGDADLGDLRLAEEVAARAALALESAAQFRTARQALRDRDEMLSFIAHDLRSPLTSLLLQVRSLRRKGGLPDRRSARPIELIERCGARMNRLIQDLVDVTKLENGAFRLRRAEVSSADLLREAAEAQRAAVEAAGLTLEVVTPPSALAVWGDRHLLLQVLDNLLGNAIKFTPSGGRVAVGLTEGAGEARFWVTDSGRGIPVEQQARLFDRFWQAAGSDRRGAGLGLTIVKGLVEAHGGRVRVESQPGTGSTFAFTVPLAPPRPPASPRASQEPSTASLEGPPRDHPARG